MPGAVTEYVNDLVVFGANTTVIRGYTIHIPF